MLAVYAIVNGNQEGWASGQTLGLLGWRGGVAGALHRNRGARRSPLMPLGLFRLRNVAVANIVGVLWAAAMFAWFFISALYLQLVLGYTPAPGRARLPAGQPDHGRLLDRPLCQARDAVRHQAAARNGLLLAAVGLVLFARAPVDGNYVVDVLPSMILLGLGAGMAFNPVLLAAMSDVEPEESGLASGVVNTSFMMGGALGLAVLASLAASRTDSLTRRRGRARSAHRRLPRRVSRRRDLRCRGGGGRGVPVEPRSAVRGRAA